MDSSNEPKSPTAHKSPIISETYSTLKNTNSNQMSKKSKELDSSDFYLSPSPGLQSRHSIEQANKMSQMNDKINLADGSVSTDTTQPVSISISKKDDQDQLKWTVSNVIGCFIPNDMAEIKIDSNQSKTKDNQDMNTDLTKSTEKVTSIDSKLSLSAETTPLVLSKNEEKPKDFLQNSSNSRTKKSDDLTKEESTSSSTVSLNLNNNSMNHQLRGRKRKKNDAQNDKKSKVSLKFSLLHPDDSIDDNFFFKGSNLNKNLGEKTASKEDDKISDIISTTNMNSSVSSEPMKVPKIRIVLPSSNSSTNLNNSSNTFTASNLVIMSSSNIANNSNSSENVSDNSTSVNAYTQGTLSQKYPYVINNNNNFNEATTSTEINDASSSEVMTTSPDTSVTNTSIAVVASSHRITRSSQRVAQQKNHSDENVDFVSTGTRKKKRASNNLNNGTVFTSISSSTCLTSASTSNSLINSQFNHSISNSNSNTVPNNNTPVDDNGEENSLGSINSNGNISSEPRDNNCTYNPYIYLPNRSSYQMFLAIRDHVKKRRKTLHIPTLNENKQPPEIDKYSVNRCDYLLRNSLPSQSSVMIDPPCQLHVGSPLYKLFLEQEQERHRMRLQHKVEQEKLMIAAQRETIRLYNRADMFKKNQIMPLSVCTYLKDEELYNQYELETFHSNDNVIIAQIKAEDPSFLNDGPSGLTGCGRIRYNGRLLLSWTNDNDEKWEKVKSEMLKRQRIEAESLCGIQKLRWQWKLSECEQESSSNEFQSSNVSDLFVPTVQVLNDFKLKP
ncbi:Ankyrin repeat domain-containing protein 12 [Sarcoptes scabiei]|nr:Ankyrin repeat domain-containing protein 12 [Sarcoptes scabiei]